MHIPAVLSVLSVQRKLTTIIVVDILSILEVSEIQY